MSRKARFAIIAIAALTLAGCKTSEIKNETPIGLADDVPTGSVQSGYGDGKGDSIGGGGAAPALDASKGSSK
jgi:hypothetical protein